MLLSLSEFYRKPFALLVIPTQAESRSSGVQLGISLRSGGLLQRLLRLMSTSTACENGACATPGFIVYNRSPLRRVAQLVRAPP